MTRRQHVLLFMAVVLLGLILTSDYSWRMAWEQGTVFYNPGVKRVLQARTEQVK